MTPVRQVVAGRTVFVTVRAVGRCFRFVPTRKICKILRYALFASLEKHEGKILLHEFEFLSNHFHLLLTDVTGCLPEFMHMLDTLLGRSINAAHGTGGTCIEKHYNDVVPQDHEKVISHAVYTLGNACSAHIVRRTKQWEGPSSYGISYGAVLEAKRPREGIWKYIDEDLDLAKAKKRRRRRSMNAKRARHRGRSTMPAVARARLVRPPISPEMSDEALRKLIHVRLDQRERELIEERRLAGKTVLGMSKAKKQKYWMSPQITEDMFGTTPSVSATSKWGRIEALQRRAVFQEAYRKARDAFVAGDRDVVFPHGTWLMKQRFGVRCHPPP